MVVSANRLELLQIADAVAREKAIDKTIVIAAMADAMAGRGSIEGAPFWSEVPFFVNRLGIPAVYCAPGDIRNCHTYDEHVDVEEYFAGIVGFASFIAGYCGVSE